jgi:hypothetical protein
MYILVLWDQISSLIVSIFLETIYPPSHSHSLLIMHYVVGPNSIFVSIEGHLTPPNPLYDEHLAQITKVHQQLFKVLIIVHKNLILYWCNMAISWQDFGYPKSK